jgi:hypothetical protein
MIALGIEVTIVSLLLIVALLYDRSRLMTRYEEGKLRYSAEVVLDSVSADGVRLTTFLLVLPKWLLAELNTHRSLSKNASSSRAIPLRRYIKQVLTNPVYLVKYGAEQRGMVAEAELDGWKKIVAEQAWLLLRYPMILGALFLHYVPGLHKQAANRILEPWVWAQDVVTGNEDMVRHFLALRDHPAAQPEMARIGVLLGLAYRRSRPRVLNDGEWHLPFILTEERWSLSLIQKIKVSVARCARASLFQAEGYVSVIRDLGLYNRLRQADPPHVSPFEHVCRPAAADHRSGNVHGWEQWRKVVESGSEHLVGGAAPLGRAA